MYTQIGKLHVGDMFLHVNRNDKSIYIITEVGKNLVIFKDASGGFDLSVTTDTVVEVFKYHL